MAYKCSQNVQRPSKPLNKTFGRVLDVGEHLVKVRSVSTTHVDRGYITVVFESMTEKIHTETIFIKDYSDPTKLSYKMRQWLTAMGVPVELLMKLIDLTNIKLVTAFKGLYLKIELKYKPGYRVEADAQGKFVLKQYPEGTTIAGGFDSIKAAIEQADQRKLIKAWKALAKCEPWSDKLEHNRNQLDAIAKTVSSTKDSSATAESH